MELLMQGSARDDAGDNGKAWTGKPASLPRRPVYYRRSFLWRGRRTGRWVDSMITVWITHKKTTHRMRSELSRVFI